VQEFWLCEACKSMNRSSSDRCYSCRTLRNRATTSTIATRQPGVVLTPGLDEEHRGVAWTLMLGRHYVSAWGLGYVAAAMPLIVVGVGALVVVAELAAMLAQGSPVPIDPRSVSDPLLGTLFLALAASGLATAVVHGAFLGLTSMNLPALGCGSPRFDPVRACIWWVESSLWAVRAGLAFVGPPLATLLAMSIGGPLFGLPVGIVWAVCAFMLLGDPITNLSKPGRLLNDLWDRLAVPGSPGPRVVGYWAGAWGVARGFDFALAAAIYLTIIVLIAVNFFGGRFGISIGNSSADDIGFSLVLLVDLALAVQWIADGVALLLLAGITIELANRQRTREKWVLDGMESGLQGGLGVSAGATGGAAVRVARQPVDPGPVGDPGGPTPGAR
jgi:hypothetical protein